MLRLRVHGLGPKGLRDLEPGLTGFHRNSEPFNSTLCQATLDADLDEGLASPALFGADLLHSGNLGIVVESPWFRV